ncbi:MAG: hypothetical protein GY913_11100 [Proteobacteria bacterium]|nr:hypothetical protein [Pseudomonadota bacterium]MCP4917461.1 hypothetical protein [Pseudomonadota bacterium]
MSYPWRLRLTHQGHSAVTLERDGRTFRFDPFDQPDEDDQIVLTWHECERAEGTLRAIRAGANPRVIAVPKLRMWLHEAGECLDSMPGGVIDKEVQVEAMEYQPIPYATPIEFVRKTKAALLSPLMAAKRLKGRAGLPEVNPMIVQLTLPDGGRFLHLNCSLHRDTPSDWLDKAAERFGGADWIVVGIDYGEDDAVLQRIGRFAPKHLLVTDLVNETRTEIGLPVSILTPTVDALCDQGLDAVPFVAGASYRYE